MTVRYGIVNGEFLIGLSGNIDGTANLSRLAQNLCARIEARPMPVRLDISEVRRADERLARFAAFMEEWVILDLGERFNLASAPGLVISGACGAILPDLPETRIRIRPGAAREPAEETREPAEETREMAEETREFAALCVA